MSEATITLQGEDLHGFEFVRGADDALLVNGQAASATVTDQVLDMCDVLVSLTLTPHDNVPLDVFERWLASVRGPV
jgi:hypothetical protein